MERELRLEGLSALPTHDVRVGRFRLFQIRHVECAVVVEPLGVFECDRRAFSTVGCDPDHTGDVLTKVVDMQSGAGLRPLYRPDLANHTDRLIALSDQVTFLVLHNARG